MDNIGGAEIVGLTLARELKADFIPRLVELMENEITLDENGILHKNLTLFEYNDEIYVMNKNGLLLSGGGRSIELNLGRIEDLGDAVSPAQRK